MDALTRSSGGCGKVSGSGRGIKMLAEGLIKEYEAGIRDFCRVDMREADLRRATLCGADLREANLNGADLRSADLRFANLNGADLRRANLRGADLSRADLSEADLRGVDLRRANLSGTKGFLDATQWLEDFESDDLGIIVYKAFGDTLYGPPEHWKIEPGEFIEEVVNPARTTSCACGVNFATREWIDKEYAEKSITIWKCRIRWMDLAGVVVPYHTDGKARCARLELLEQIT